MTERDLPDNQTVQGAEHRPSRKRHPWEEVVIDGEKFLVIRNLTAPFLPDGKEDPIAFRYDEYRHIPSGMKNIDSGMQIQVWSLGMDQPQNLPAVARLDYGCPCMQSGPGLPLLGHDCAQQRKLMFETIAEVGIGAIATISEVTAAGNGHGSHAVLQQATIQYEALMKGQPIPSMREAQAEIGYYNDVRRHEIAASVLAHSIGRARPIWATTANPDKLAYQQQAGLNVVEGVRVELVTPSQSRQSRTLESRRRRDGYLAETSFTRPGAYLVTGDGAPVRLTKSSYERITRPRPTRARRTRAS